MTLATDPTATPSAADGALRRLNVSGKALKRISRIIAREGKPGLYLRISVTGGGCSGFQYNYDLTDAPITEEDHRFGTEESPVIVDDVSLDLLAGAELEFVDDLMGQYFKMNNPNAASSCGCGTSFAI